MIYSSHIALSHGILSATQQPLTISSPLHPLHPGMAITAAAWQCVRGHGWVGLHRGAHHPDALQRRHDLGEEGLQLLGDVMWRDPATQRSGRTRGSSCWKVQKEP